MTVSIATPQPLLIELLTEELPPKALNTLGQAFAAGIRKTLEQSHLLAPDCVVTDFATPRRLAVVFSAVLGQAPEQSYTEKLMPAKVGLTENGEATPALLKKLASKDLQHLKPSDLVRESDGKQDYLYAHGNALGVLLADGLQTALDYTLSHLPIPKVMRYQLADGITSIRFVRPAHGLIALWGQECVPVQALGLNSGSSTQGHRFMSSGHIDITDANSYEQQLHDAKVIASFSKRRGLIAEQLQIQADALGATIGDSAEATALLDEVTALVEHPTVYVGEFDPAFLDVPPECLILTMRLNQKYFPLFQPDTGVLTHKFLIVSNMQTENPVHIIEGNQRVIRPRLADAQFFFETDRKISLADRVADLATSVYHNKLGSQLERVARVRYTASYLATQLNVDHSNADRAALLAKADLGSNMVAEFPELQGIMGAYYAQADGEPADIVLALKSQYRIRLDSPVDNTTLTAALLFIADRAVTLVGIWGIGLIPSGERDPFGLRRAALGIISALEQLAAGGYLAVTDSTRLTIPALLQAAASQFPDGTLSETTVNDVTDFIYERLRNQLNNEFDRTVVDAVLALQPAIHQVHSRIHACLEFAKMPEAASLAAANKRISNLLKKADSIPNEVNAEALTEPAEQQLAQLIAKLKPIAMQQFLSGDFTASLATLAHTKDAVDDFFNNVMIMADDPLVRNNRLALLNQLHHIMNQVADISRLAQ